MLIEFCFCIFCVGVLLFFLKSPSVLTNLFCLELLFFSIFLSLVKVANFYSIYLILILIISSGVIGLCVFMQFISSFSQEVSNSFLD